jgi:glycosyltransferase involved in cell wall biosynthesis
MRILYVSPNSNLGSTTSSLNAILRELQPRGLEPVMLFREPGPWQRELQEAGIPCYFDPLRIPGKSRPVRSLLDIYRLVRLVRRERIDLIHCNEHHLYPLMRRVGRWATVPIVATLHWNLDSGFGGWAFRPPFLPAALQFLSRKQLELSRPALPPEVGPERVKLLMSGLAIDDLLARGGSGEELRASWNVAPGTVVIGTASAIKPRKRLEDFVRLISRLRGRRLPVVGIIAGGGKYVDPAYQTQITDLIRQEGLEDHCRMIGFVNPITPFFKAIDISVNTCEMEILSMSLCEALACGRPTLAYDVGGNPETLPTPWCVAPFGDVAALEAKLAKLVTDADFRHQQGIEAERFVRVTFDAPALAARQAAIYEEILGRPMFGLPARPVASLAS